MRVALLLVVLVVLLGLCVACHSDGEARSRIAAQFQQVIASRQERLAAKASSTGARGSDADLIRNNGVVKPRDTAELLSLLPDSGYREAVVAQLKSASPTRRGLACELLRSCFDVTALPAIGALLDDKEKCIFEQWGQPQSGRDYVDLSTTTVGEVAQKALNGMVGIEFSTKADFDIWWKANRRWQDKLWYWASRWRYEATAEQDDWQGFFYMIALDPNPDIVASDIAGAFSKLPPDSVSRILLLVKNEPAMNDAVGLSLGEKDCWQRAHGEYWWLACSGPSKQLLIDYIKAHRLQGRLVQLLQQKKLYPEVASGGALTALAEQIRDLSADLFTAADDPAIAAAESVNTPFKAPITELVLLRTQLVPDQSQAILRDALIKDPSLWEIAQTLAKNLGPDDADALVKSFQTIDKDQRYYVAGRVMGSAGKAKGIDLALIGRLAKEVPGLRASTYDRTAETLCCLARAANTVSGVELISEEDIKAATMISYKGNLTDAEKAHNASLPQAIQTLKARLLAVLP